MARRDRTTGLPRPRRRVERDDSADGGGWFPPSEQQLRLGILTAAALLLVLVLGIFVYRWYDDNFARPGKTVLTAGDETFSLGYFSDRLGPFFQSNQTSISLAPQALLAKLEAEALALQIAAGRGIEITEDGITAAIADDLGVPLGGSGSAFDNAYRQRLTTTGMSDSSYRRLTEASEADRLLRQDIRTELGETGETVTLRLVVVRTEEAGDEIVARINTGEDMGTLAQVESLDAASRVEDGLSTSPPTLLPQAVQDAIDGSEVGVLIGPFESEGLYWVVRVERTDDEGSLSEAQLDGLVALRFDALIAEARAATEIERNLSAGDIDWAFQNTG